MQPPAAAPPPLSFGHAALVGRLVDELQASLRPGAGSSTEPALVVGVFGEWGAGKSRLLQAVAADIQERSKQDGEQVLTVVVPFNAWRYEREEHLLVPLLRVAQQCLRKAIDDSLGTDIKRHERLSDQLLLLGDLAQVVYEHGGRDLLQAALTAHGAAIKLPVMKAADGKPNPGVWEVLASRRKLRANARRLDTPISQLQSLYYDFLEHLKAVTGRNPMALNAHRQRLLRRGAGWLTDVSFNVRMAWEWFLTGELAAAPSVQVNLVFLVDDLDRCLPDKAVEVLEAVKLFLEVEGCAFVLALDEEVIERGIAHRYRDYALQGKEGMTPITGAEYLEKLVHLPVRLPRPTGAATRDFLATKWPDWFADVLGQPNDLSTLVTAITPSVPRKLYRMTSLLALAESLGAGDVKTPRRREWLAIVCALQLFAPALYRYLRLHGAQYLITLADWRTDALFRDVAGLRQALQAQVRSVGSPVQLQHQLVLHRLPDLCEAVMHNRSGFDVLELLARVGDLHREAPLTSAQLGALLVFMDVDIEKVASRMPDATEPSAEKGVAVMQGAEHPGRTEPVAQEIVPSALKPASSVAGEVDSGSVAQDDTLIGMAEQPRQGRVSFEARLENERSLVESVSSGSLELARVALSREGSALRGKLFPESTIDLLLAGPFQSQVREWVAQGAPKNDMRQLLVELEPHMSQRAAFAMLLQFGTPAFQVLRRPNWAIDVQGQSHSLRLLGPSFSPTQPGWLQSGDFDEASDWQAPLGWRCENLLMRNLSIVEDVHASAGSDGDFGVYVDIHVVAAEGIAALKQRMRWVQPGDFVMGPSKRESGARGIEGESRVVNLSRGYWIADTACTQGLWRRLMGDVDRRDWVSRLDSLPVVGVRANRVEQFLLRLSELLPGCQPSLPSEAEWECACRAGTRTAYAFGDEVDATKVNAKSGRRVPVGSLPPNAWGLYEMHGNVAELCRDWLLQSDRSPVNARDPEGEPGTSSGWHALRGGSKGSSFKHTRSAYVSRFPRNQHRDDVGFRFIIRPIDEPNAEVSK